MKYSLNFKLKVMIFSLSLFFSNIFAQEWDIQISSTSATLRDVIFLDNQNGIAVGDSSTILKTSDAGLSWIKIASPIDNVSFGKVYQIDRTNIFIIGSGGIILKSTDMGDTWSIQLHESSYIFQNIYFINNSTGWICGNAANSDVGGVIFKTTDGGNSWFKQLETLDNSKLPNYKISDIFFYNSNTGIALGNVSFDNFGHTYILKTEDGGDNWYLFSHTKSYLVTQFSKSSKDIIWAGGIGFEISADSGKTWKNFGSDAAIPNFIFLYDMTVSDIVQITGKRGYLLSYDFNGNKRRLYYTGSISLGFHSVKIPDDGTPLALTICDNNFLCMVGQNGLILKSRWLYTDIKNTINNNSFNNFDFINLYPNPFNPSTTISYSIPEEGKVQINIFDALGREITTLTNEMMSAGKHSIVWNGANFSSGVYFCRISFKGQALCKKMLLVK